MGLNLPRAAMALVVASSAAAGWAQAGFNADVMNNYGGRYSSACQDPAAPSLTVTRDALVFALRGKTITGREVEAAYSYFGNSPPPNYRVALMSHVSLIGAPSPALAQELDREWTAAFRRK